jgi:hypothetical protein
MFLQNLNKRLPDYTASHPRRYSSSPVIHVLLSLQETTFCSHILSFYFGNGITSEGKINGEINRIHTCSKFYQIIEQVSWNIDSKATICKVYFKLIPTNNVKTLTLNDGNESN